MSKTKVIWFGQGCNSQLKLCPNLNLDWTTSFKLLGVEFTNNLQGMDCNFDSKIQDIKNLFDNWLNRKLSIYGKITVVKSLALSKLSHLALVLPSLKPDQIKQLESLVFKFLWDNKPDKVSRDHAKLKENAGGLGVPDIKTFWLSLKFSWFRRALSTNSFWPKILLNEVQDITELEIKSVDDIMIQGPNEIGNIGKKLSNQFWKQVFSSVGPIMQGAISCYPEKMFTAPLWENPLFL